jgi:transcription factor E
MLKDLLKEVISAIAGKPAEDIVDLLDEQKHVNEFVIAKKLDLTINQVRNILYKISDYGLVSSIRKKDKRKGWYTYFWKIEILKTLEFLKENMVKKVENLHHQIKSRETKRFYVCERCHIELSEENALLNNFTCNECGAILTLKDNSKVVRDLRKNKEKLERDMKIVDDEILKERGKEEKKKTKEINKIEKARKKTSLEKSQKRKKEKAQRIKMEMKAHKKKIGSKKEIHKAKPKAKKSKVKKISKKISKKKKR